MILFLTTLIIFLLIASVIYIKTKYFTEKNLPEEPKKEKYICSECMVGKRTYALDPDSLVCPYISSCKNNQCEFYVPIKGSGIYKPQ